jgi:hypothetical protein
MSRASREPLRVVFGGSFARVPRQGGLAWVVLQWVLGLRRLGHQVLLLEPLRRDDLLPAGTTLRASANAAEFLEIVRAFGLEDTSALVSTETGESWPLDRPAVERTLRGADLLLDIAGGLRATALATALECVPVRVYLDVDPCFTQLWHAAEGIDMRLDGHTHFATVGLRLGEPGCTVPTCGLDWIPTAPPVLLAEWPFAAPPERHELTTVAHWRGYGSIVEAGVHYGQKAHSLRRFFDLPRRAGERFELALAIDPGEPDDLAALAANGWRLLDPLRVAGTPRAYRRFVQGSRGELGVAKSGYVASRSGWFSDRSACYLASGRPVIAQDTGFGERLPVGRGLFAFATADDVAAAIEELERDYSAQRRAAREIAEQYLDAERVIPRLLQRVGAAA